MSQKPSQDASLLGASISTVTLSSLPFFPGQMTCSHISSSQRSCKPGKDLYNPSPPDLLTMPFSPSHLPSWQCWGCHEVHWLVWLWLRKKAPILSVLPTLPHNMILVSLYHALLPFPPSQGSAARDLPLPAELHSSIYETGTLSQVDLEIKWCLFKITSPV